jgi:hypothetical protein
MGDVAFNELLNQIDDLTADQRQQLLAKLWPESENTAPTQSLYDALKKRGMIGSITDGPGELGTNPHQLPGIGPNSLQSDMLQSIDAIIATEVASAEILGEIKGIPRTYGDARTDTIWRQCIVDGAWKSAEDVILPVADSVFITFSFRVNPHHFAYRNMVSKNGPDLDTMVIGALAGLTDGRSKLPTLRMIVRSSIFGIAARKELVESPEEGVTISVSRRSTFSHQDCIKAIAAKPALRIAIARGRDRRLASKLATEAANTTSQRFGTNERIGLRICFNATGPQFNPFTADHLEQLIDGLAAAKLGDSCMFDHARDQSNSTRYDYDDSNVFGLIIGKFVSCGSNTRYATAEIFRQTCNQVNKN